MAREFSTRIDTQKQTYWIGIFCNWESSGETVRAYCVRHGLKETQFYWWKRVLQTRGQWKPGQCGKRSKLPPEKSSLPFAEVQLQESAAPEISEPRETARSEARLELCVGERFRIRIRPGFDPFTLEGLLSVLEGRGC